MSRPVPPEIIVKTILIYLENKPEKVVDLGSGTGLSAMIWNDIADSIVGIEPNDDMRITAENNTKSDHIIYRKGFSHRTDLPSDYADIVTVSQAFHWMNIDDTLLEIDRILKNDGVLAIFDCDWPPSVNWVIEKAYRQLKNKCDDICSSQEEHAVRNDRNTYVNKLNDSGKFRFVRETVCHSLEKCTPRRMFGFALS